MQDVAALAKGYATGLVTLDVLDVPAPQTNRLQLLGKVQLDSQVEALGLLRAQLQVLALVVQDVLVTVAKELLLALVEDVLVVQGVLDLA